MSSLSAGTFPREAGTRGGRPPDHRGGHATTHAPTGSPVA
jgi:hypothetical protein